jgi:hypothetical protein
MSEADYTKDGWRPSWKPSPPPMVSTAHLSRLLDRDELAVDPIPLIFSPVETETADHMRLRSIEAIKTRVEVLQARGRYQRLTVFEARELEQSQGAIHTLQRMAPVGALLPARPGNLFSGNLA